MRDRFSFIVPVVTVVAISVAFWVVMTSAIAWSLVFLTGALHSSGLTQIPALSFWQSVGVLLLVFLLSIPLRAGRINISKEGKGER
jgi:hypothetical protein